MTDADCVRIRDFQILTLHPLNFRTEQHFSATFFLFYKKSLFSEYSEQVKLLFKEKLFILLSEMVFEMNLFSEK